MKVSLKKKILPHRRPIFDLFKSFGELGNFEFLKNTKSKKKTKKYSVFLKNQ